MLGFRRIFRLLLVVLGLALTSCVLPGAASRAPSDASFPPIMASSPPWMVPAMLGTPLDSHFQPLQSAGSTLFPGAPVTTMRVDDFEHDYSRISDTSNLDANLSAWGGVLGIRGGMGTSSAYRFAVYRAYDVQSVTSVDDRYPHRQPPPGAVWYPVRIYWGHSYEVTCYGDARRFTTSLAAKLMLAKGGVSAMNGHDGVQCRLTGRGLEPKKAGAIFAGSPQEVRAAYDDVGPPSPIYVEYRAIPGATPPPPGQITWLSPYAVEVRFNSVHIDLQRNFFRVQYYATGSCTVDGQQQAPAPAGIVAPAPAPGQRMPAPPPPARPVLSGDRGKTGDTLTTTWTADLSAVRGDRVACGLQGRFQGVAKSGPIPGASMPDTPITGPGTFSGAFHGANSDTRYTVNYTVTVRAQ
jgi:hypothetical protein